MIVPAERIRDETGGKDENDQVPPGSQLYFEVELVEVVKAEDATKKEEL